LRKSRLEAFSDGVIAILITIMVLELHAPHGNDWSALREVLPSLLTYLLSFVFLGIYWNNHHHLLQATERINGVTLWANLHLLFWLSLIPFVTSWMDDSRNAAVPTAAYGVVLLLCAIAFTVLVRTLLAAHPTKNTRLAEAVGSDRKGKLSLLFYVAGIPLAFVNPKLADAMYVIVALIWLVPDPRIESRFRGATEQESA